MFKSSKVTRNILIHRLGSLGDFIVALPCFHLIRRAYPDSRIVLMTNHPVSGKAAPAMEVLEGTGLCDEAFAYPVALRDPSALLALRRKIRTYSFEVAVELKSDREWLPALRDHLFLRACGISKLVGTQVWSKDRTFRHSSGPMVEQECSRLARRIRAIGNIDIRDRISWDLRLNAAEREKAGILLREQTMPDGFIAASVGTKLAAKDWGSDNWGKLAALLSKRRPQLGLVLIGASEESALSDAVREAWVGPTINLCGRSSPRESAAVIERSVLFVGHDSGPMHLAAAVGAPVVAVFSWHNPPGQWHPGWTGWTNIRVLYPPLPNGVWNTDLRMRRSLSEGILLISPEQVAHECFALLNRSADQLSPGTKTE
jgi:heptosyltransferase III